MIITKINVYVGINVQKLQFEQSNGTKGFHNGVVTYPVQATHKNLVNLFRKRKLLLLTLPFLF